MVVREVRTMALFVIRTAGFVPRGWCQLCRTPDRARFSLHYRQLVTGTLATPPLRSRYDRAMATILCVDDEATSLLVLQSILDAAGHDTTGVSSVDAALDVLSRGEFDLITSDYRMPGATGLELLARLRELGIETPLIMATGYATIEHAVASIKSGAIDYITKPFREEQLRLVVDQALELVSLRRENET